jgi:hypothetical protein
MHPAIVARVTEAGVCEVICDLEALEYRSIGASEYATCRLLKYTADMPYQTPSRGLIDRPVCATPLPQTLIPRCSYKPLSSRPTRGCSTADLVPHSTRRLLSLSR